MKGARKPVNQGFYAALLLLALGGAATIGYLASRPKEVAITMTDPKLLPKAEGYVMGDPNAPVEIMEFGDFECPSCAQFAVVSEPDVRKRIVGAGLARFRYFDYPLPMHPNTWFASHAAACANDQGKFWDMHDALYNGQDKWNAQATRSPKGIFKEYAKAMGLNVSQWEECYDSRKHQLRIEANKAEGDRRRVSSTPTFVIGKRMIGTGMSSDYIKLLVDSARMEAGVSSGSPTLTDSAAARQVPVTPRKPG